MMKLFAKIENINLWYRLRETLLTGNIALNKCVIKFDPFCTAFSPSLRLAIECPSAIAIPFFDNSSITSKAPTFSGARVIIVTLSNAPYVSVTDFVPFRTEFGYI